MLRSLYSGISGMNGFQTKLDVIGNNVANVSTVGYKSSRVMFSDILSQKVAGATAPTATVGGVNPQQIGLGSTTSAIETVHTAGSMQTTNVPTDLAIEGDGYFIVSPTGIIAADGSVADAVITRAGNFTRDSAGNLVTAQGYFVMGKDANGDTVKITINSNSPYDIAKDGTVNILGVTDATDAAGNLTNPPNKVGLAYVQNPAGLEKVGNTMYRMTVNANPNAELTISVPKAAGTGSIISGRLEMSNVSLTSQLTEMIVAQRGFQANSRIITVSDSVLEEVVNLKR